MNCLIHLLAVCVFDPTGVYLTAGVSSQVHDGDKIRYAQQCYNTAWCVRDKPPGPVGTLKLGVSAELVRGLVLDYGLEHRSFVDTNRDNGQEFAFVSLTWKPFR